MKNEELVLFQYIAKNKNYIKFRETKNNWVFS